MIESKCPKCKESFVSELFSYAETFKCNAKWRLPFMETYDWSTDNVLEEGLSIQCHHCKQIYKIKLDPILE